MRVVAALLLALCLGVGAFGPTPSGFATRTTLRTPVGFATRTALRLTEEQASQVMEVKTAKQESARSTGLALALDDGTRKSHSVAENTQFVTGFFKGISTRSSFSQLVASLYFVYEAMEDEFDKSTHPAVKR